MGALDPSLEADDQTPRRRMRSARGTELGTPKSPGMIAAEVIHSR